jgi:glycerophosphoryl diester phosphodiesterase
MSEPQKPPVEIVAHRGTGKDYPNPVGIQAHRPSAPPENTLPAFALGWERGVTCELDVHVTSDGEIIVIHDQTTGRTCGVDLNVGASTLAELRALDAGIVKGPIWAGLRLPLLSEVLEIMPPGRRLYVEMKQGPGIIAPLLEVIDASGKGPDEIVFISFSIDSITEMKRQRPQFTCYWIVVFEELKPGVWRCGYDHTEPDGLTFKTTWQQPVDYDALVTMARNDGRPVDGIDASFVQPDDFPEAMRRLGMPWGTWAVDDADVALHLAASGAIQITSNCTDDVRDALRFGAAR